MRNMRFTSPTIFIYSSLIFLSAAYPSTLFGSIALQHLILLLVVLHANTLFLLRKNVPFFALLSFLTVVFLIILALIAISLYTLPPRFYDEFLKISLIILGSTALAYIFDNATLLKILSGSALFFALYLLIFIITNDNPYTYGGRLEIQGYGSPNTMSLICAIYIVSILCNIWLNYPSRLEIATYTLIVVFLLWVMFNAESRGGFFSLFAAGFCFLLIALLRGKPIALIVLFALVLSCIGLISAAHFIDVAPSISRYSMITDHYDSGRLYIWKILIEQLSSSPTSYIFGYAPGSIEVYGFGKFFYSAHSLFISILYYFGTIGLFLLTAFMVVTLFRILICKHPKGSAIAFSFWGLFFFSALVDNTVLASQALIYSAMVLTLFSSLLWEAKNDARVMNATSANSPSGTSI